jgi:hemerythrin superfamily protein
MPDAISVLTTDHREVEALFTRVEGKDSPDPSVVDKIVKELSIHDAIERQYLYPTVRDKVGSGEGMADHSIEEHNMVAQTLLNIDKAEGGSKEQAQLLTALMGMVKSHVQEEEEKIFPAMRSAMSKADLDALGEELTKAKETAPTRPHPHAPNEGLGAKLAGAASAPLDKARDAASRRT